MIIVRILVRWGLIFYVSTKAVCVALSPLRALPRSTWYRRNENTTGMFSHVTWTMRYRVSLVDEQWRHLTEKNYNKESVLMRVRHRDLGAHEFYSLRKSNNFYSEKSERNNNMRYYVSCFIALRQFTANASFHKVLPWPTTGRTREEKSELDPITADTSRSCPRLWSLGV